MMQASEKTAAASAESKKPPALTPPQDILLERAGSQEGETAHGTHVGKGNGSAQKGESAMARMAAAAACRRAMLRRHAG